MKLLIWHARKLKMEIGAHGGKLSRWKREIRELKKRLGPTLGDIRPNAVFSASNALFVLACAETFDRDLELRKPRDAIIKSRAMLGVSEIVIAAFGHLSDQPANPILAREIIDDLEKAVKGEFQQTRQVPFGWDKSLELKVPLHHYNCSLKYF